MPTPNTSPGRALSERVLLEQRLTRVVLAQVRTFTQGVFTDALAALRAPVLMASTAPASSTSAAPPPAEPFTLGQATRRWELVVTATCAEVGDYLGQPPPPASGPHDAYLAAVQRRLQTSPLLGQTYTAAREVLALSAHERWAESRTRSELRTALDLDTPLTAPDPTPLTAAGGRRSPQRSRARRVSAPAPPRPPPPDPPPPLPKPRTPLSAAAAARQLARTEATSAYSSYALWAIKLAGGQSKRWVAHHDAKTRPTHAEADGQTVPLTSVFLVGGFALMHPGDPNGPDQETANCRCTLINGSLSPKVDQNVVKPQVPQVVRHGNFMMKSEGFDYLRNPTSAQDAVKSRLNRAHNKKLDYPLTGRTVTLVKGQTKTMQSHGDAAKMKGYSPDAPPGIGFLDTDGLPVLFDGHHRTIAAWDAGAPAQMQLVDLGALIPEQPDWMEDYEWTDLLALIAANT